MPAAPAEARPMAPMAGAQDRAETIAAGGIPAGFAGAKPHGRFRRWLRRSIHFLAYRFILARRKVRVTRAAGFRLTVRPTVFHPRWFISSTCFAKFISGLDLRGQHVAEIGTGSGILALAAARAGAKSVVALDINPNAALNAAENAQANGFGDRVSPVCANLFSALPPRPLFDVILSSPPKHAGEPLDLADRGWHAGPDYRDIAALFDEARPRLKPGGRLYVMVSSDTDLSFVAGLIARAGFDACVALEHSIYIEKFIIYELSALESHLHQVEAHPSTSSPDPFRPPRQ
jgi:release factor glutamine methyltransferase